ncbi:MAG: hypothetical protein Q8M03_05185, partial [Legionella sp.]|nr:hypothetical protein [Legionella sp.]
MESNLLLHFQARDHNLWRGWNVPVVLNDVENQSFTSMVLIHSNQLCSCKERDSVDSNPLEQKKQKNTQQESKERSPTVANVPSTTVLGSFIRFLFQLGIWAAWLSMCGGTIVGLLLGGWKLGGIVGNYIKKNIIEVVVVT